MRTAPKMKATPKMDIIPKEYPKKCIRPLRSKKNLKMKTHTAPPLRPLLY